MIKAVVVDDERPSLSKLVKLLANSALAEVVGEFTKPSEMLAFLASNRVDAVFLDIEMPEMDGIALAGKVIDIQKDAMIVFVTAYDQYAVEAFRINALDYLMKPVTADRLSNTLNRIAQSAPADHAADIQINCFGRFTIKNGTAKVRFRTEKAEELLAFIIDRRGGFTSRSDIIDSLWPEFDGDRALIHFNTTLHYVRKALLRYGVIMEIAYDHGGYSFDMRDMPCDYIQFCRFVEKRKSLSQENISEFEDAAKLFAGEYLSGWECDWAAVRRIYLLEQYLRIVADIARYYRDCGDMSATDDWLKAGLIREPLHRELNYRLMEALLIRKEHALASKYYEIYKSGLYHKLRKTPDEAFRKLFDEFV